MNIKSSSWSAHLWPFALHSSGTGEPPRTALDAALHCFEQGHATEAYAALRELADRGDPAAARMASMLAQRGAALFGGSFAASPAERERWRRAQG